MTSHCLRNLRAFNTGEELLGGTGHISTMPIQCSICPYAAIKQARRPRNPLRCRALTHLDAWPHRNLLLKSSHGRLTPRHNTRHSPSFSFARIRHDCKRRSSVRDHFHGDEAQVAAIAAARQSRHARQIEAGLPASSPKFSDDEDDPTMQTGSDDTKPTPSPVHAGFTMEQALSTL